MGVRTLLNLSEDDSLQESGDTKDPKDAEQRLLANDVDVEEDKAPQPHNAASTLEGPRVLPHTDLVHLHQRFH